MTIQITLEQNKEYIIQLYQSGISTNKIAKEFNCNSGNIYFFLERLGIPIKKRKKFSGDIEDYDVKIIEMFNSGMSCYQISKNLQISKPCILSRAKKLGLNTSLKNKVNNNNLLKDKSEIIINLHKQKMSQGEIARKIGHSQSQISNFLKKNDLTTNKWKYKIDESFFKKIESQEQAYILGLCYANFCINLSGRIRIKIFTKDVYILEFIKNIMKYSGPILEYYQKYKTQKQSILIINRKCLALQLVDLGCRTNKNRALKFPNFEKIPYTLFHHFIRGYFDCKGLITKKFNINIISSVEFCEELQKYCLTCGINSKLCVYKHKRRLFISNYEDKIKFFNLIYTNASIFVQRKYDRFVEFI